MWLGNELNPTDWVWKRSLEGIQTPIYTEEKLIPDSLIEQIFCSCEKGSTFLRCSCRKDGLKCSNLCDCCGLENCSIAENLHVEIIGKEDISEECEEQGNLETEEEEAVEEEVDEEEEVEK